ncbi:MAG: DUF3604 domain-containing protein [candidate division KSB1 bacterium]|nr:DUF3604 domain-containing protein [candidate division KSB1 bacterium]MDZ7301495.1 DUF3604 domain-containing protein [candidate division KSB1 bacterium]MDZ7310897.1 DUF3604 domain-containing protein [candidate division KSB1 bacterium]
MMTGWQKLMNVKGGWMPLNTLKFLDGHKHGRRSVILFHMIAGVIFLICPLGLIMAQTKKQQAMMTIISPQTAMVRTPGTWRLSFVIQADSMAIGGGLKIRFVKGFSQVQNEDPNSPNYVTVSTSNPRATVSITSIDQRDRQVPWDWDRNAWVVTAMVGQRALSRGDTIHVVYGANPPKGRLMASPTAFVDTVLVAYDLEASGIYRELAQKPLIAILPRAPYRLRGYLPTTSQVGMPAILKIVVRDEYDNLATSFVGTMVLSATDSLAILPKTVELTPSDSGRKNVEVRFQTRGVHYVKLRALGMSPDSLWQVRSNPVKVTLQPQYYQIYWGDLHSHSCFSHDGHGRDSFRKARDVACLDFYALTDHTSNDYKTHGGLTQQEWEATKRNVIRYHAPGQFVTFPAYEFSAVAPSGHHNIYFNAPDDRIAEIPVFADNIYLQVQKVWELKDAVLPAGIDMLTIPQHTGVIWHSEAVTRPWVSFGEGFANPQLRTLIEMYSAHGSSEWYAPEHPLSYRSLWQGERDCASGPHYAQDAWAVGEMLGVIASSDDHSSRPGQEYYGLTAVYARELTRDAVWDALKKRRTYATTGQRMIVQFNIDDFLMGSQIKLETGKYPKINLQVDGTDDLDFVEVLRWDWRKRPTKNGHPFFETIRFLEAKGSRVVDSFVDSTYDGSSIYYLRAKQKRDIMDLNQRVYRQVWAWSSPIWVVAPQLLDTSGSKPAPQQLQLRPNYPNPFSRQTSFTYYVPRDGKVEISLYNVLGQRVQRLLHEVQTTGWHGLEISARNLAEGIYFIRLEVAGQVGMKKVILIR